MRASPTNNRKTRRRSASGSNSSGITPCRNSMSEGKKREKHRKEFAKTVAAAKKVNVEPRVAYRDLSMSQRRLEVVIMLLRRRFGKDRVMAGAGSKRSLRIATTLTLPRETSRTGGNFRLLSRTRRVSRRPQRSVSTKRQALLTSRLRLASLKTVTEALERDLTDAE